MEKNLQKGRFSTRKLLDGNKSGKITDKRKVVFFPHRRKGGKGKGRGKGKR